MNKLYLNIVVVIILFMGVSCVKKVKAPYEIKEQDYTIYKFEGSVPKEFSSDMKSKLSIADYNFKTGQKSLRWEWNSSDSYIKFTNAEAFKHLTGENPDPIVYDWVTFCNLSRFNVWIFSEKPLYGSLRFELGKAEFYANMNFSGWRNLSLLYGRDLNKFPAIDAEILIIRPPKGVDKGVIYFDDFAPRTEFDVRFVQKTTVAPYVNNKNLSSNQVVYMNEDCLTEPKKSSNYNEMLLDLGIFPVKKVSLQQKEILKNMQRKYYDRYLPKTFAVENLENKHYEQYSNLHPFIPKNYDNHVQRVRKRFNISRNGEFVNASGFHIAHFYQIMQHTAIAYHYGNLTAEQKAESLELLIDMADYIIQHGHTAWYNLRERYFLPLLLMKKEFIHAKRWEPLLNRLRSILSVDRLYSKTRSSDADIFNTELLGMLGVVLLNDENMVQQWNDFQALKYWLDKESHCSVIMPDGSIIHHQMYYLGYSLPVQSPLTFVLSLTSNTPFFSQMMYNKMKKCLIQTSMFSSPYMPHMFSGRWRICYKYSMELAQNLAVLADCVVSVDRELAAHYMYWCEYFTQQNNSMYKKFRKLGIKTQNIEGSMPLNIAVSLSHRYNGYVATVRGQRNTIFANEQYSFQGGNTMGRYLNYGQIQVLGGDPEQSGFVMDKGWNFNFWPGTTSREIPLTALRSHFENIESLTNEYFAGAVELNKVGSWAMKLQEEQPDIGDARRIGPPRYYLGETEYQKRLKESMLDLNFKARKSMFFYKDTILALGSSITSTDKNSSVVTTLAQNSMTKAMYNKIKIHKNYLIDGAGNGFYFGNAKPIIKHGIVNNDYYPLWNERSKEHTKIKENRGDMQLIYLDHGKAPTSASYKYYMLIQPTAERMNAFAADIKNNKAPIKVIRQTKNTHIVSIPNEKIFSYVLFEKGEVNHDIILSVDNNIMLMTKKIGNKVKLSIYNPYLPTSLKKEVNTQDIIQKPYKTKIKLNGSWKLTGKSKLVEQISENIFVVTNEELQQTEFEIIKL